ncbi:ABC transporter ATP-binding protein [Egicoccus halophilus]|uniref:ABC transporter n=1 Tax=Egicoccus halophilus TaxID=1670830 RepID=A0A8J3ESC1_9ACTN|nr:ABC transporter ATP-binding protein [Egicoccus halophilus]GGI02694.1 ABC transporter [Egicoccus halophilus]
MSDTIESVSDDVPVPPPPPAAAVTVRGLTKRYGDLAAVDGLDLDVPRGGVFGLVGPNGAGKTTTMLATVTLLRPDEGRIDVLGHDPVTDPRAVRGVVGYVPDTFGLYDGLSCREYLDFFAAAYEVPREGRAAQVDALLELVELSHKAATDVAGLSRGMQQRLSLARGLVHDPQVLVADEPASGLDPRARVELREIVKELAVQGVTIVISSHILAELDELCDRVAIVEAGKVLAQGTADEIRGAVQASSTVTVRVLGGEDALAVAATLAAGTGALVTPEEGRLRCEVVGGEAAAAELLRTLVVGGVRVTDFREDRGGLERLFLSVTQGVVR